MTGHADGMARFLDEDTVIGNKPLFQKCLSQRIKAVLAQAGIHALDSPYYESSTGGGYYPNFPETNETFFLPVFDSNIARSAVDAAQQIFTKAVVPIQIRAIAAEGAV